jgi:hypothetical protein
MNLCITYCTAGEFKTDQSSIIREIKTPTLLCGYPFLWGALAASLVHPPTGSLLMCISNSKGVAEAKKRCECNISWGRIMKFIKMIYRYTAISKNNFRMLVQTEPKIHCIVN